MSKRPCAMCGGALSGCEEFVLRGHQSERHYHWLCSPAYVEYLRRLPARTRARQLRADAFVSERQRQLIARLARRSAVERNFRYIVAEKGRYMVRLIGHHAYAYRREHAEGKGKDLYLGVVEDLVFRYGQDGDVVAAVQALEGEAGGDRRRKHT